MAAKSKPSLRRAPGKKAPPGFLSPLHISRDELESKYQALLEEQTRLELSLGRYVELFHASPVGYLTLSHTGMIKEINSMGERLLGLTRSQLLGTPLVVFVAESHQQKLFQFLSRLRRLSGCSNVELQLKTKTKEPLFVDLVAMASIGRDQARAGFQCALIDISAQQKALSDLRVSEQKFRRLASHAPVGIFLCDKDGDNHYVNPKWCEITGLAVEQALGKGWLRGIHPEDRGRIMAWGEAAQRFGCSDAEFRFVRPSGGVVWVQASALPMKPEEDFMGYIGTIIDITDRKSSQEAIQRLAAIVEFSHDAIVGNDINGIITSWNRGAEEVFGYSTNETIGRPVTLLIPPELQVEEKEILKRVRRGNYIDHYETVRRHKSGRLLDISLTISPIKDANGKVIGASKIARDITEEKRIHRELNNVHAQVLAASRAKDDFLATLSHELRTPLNPVLLLSSEAAANHELPPRIRTDFDTIRKNIELEARLIDDMLDLTRIANGKLELRLEPIEVHQILRSALATVQNEIRHKHITLVLDFKAKQQRISGDAVRLQQVFWNVLKNATKFTPQNGRISINTRSVDSKFRVQISDTGIGMVPSEIDGLFQPFSQGTHSGFGGLGLGLTISKKLVDLHHGSIRAASPGRGAGATFTIDFPVSGDGTKHSPVPKRRVRSAKRSSPPKEGAVSIRLLLVEDHEPTRLALSQLLVRRGYRVEAAASLAEARASVKAHEFDLLISDIGLPDGNGCDLMREMSQSQRVQGIALTGYGMEEDLEKTRRAGFMAHLTKPVGVEALENALASALAANGHR